MQYRASFLMEACGTFLLHLVEFGALWALFDRFGQIKGWGFAEIGLFYGIINVGFAIADALGSGFDEVGGMVKAGEFDRVLVRPRSTALQVAGQDISIKRVGRLTMGLLVLGWAVWSLGVVWTAGKMALLVFAIGAGAATFLGVFILQATLAFWTVESLEIMNTLTYGGTETAQYPLSIYRNWMRRLFTYAVPLACVNYYPGLVILGKADPLGAPWWLGWVTPCAGFVFLFAALRVWRVGERRYLSTGS
jgi:ABC-2 type transport system permease protein